jgi:hypothetical protein
LQKAELSLPDWDEPLPNPELRDKFALAVVTGLSKPMFLTKARERRRVALLAYALADEMLKARNLDPAAIIDSLNG